MALKKILVLDDLSEGSERAFKRAVEIAEGKDEPVQIILLHVISEIPLHGSFSSPILSSKTGEWVTSKEEYLKELYHSMKQDAANHLRQKISHLGAAKMLIRVEVRVGEVYDRTLEYVNSEDIDLMIVAASKIRGIAKIKPLGNLAIRLANDAPCPVMIIH